MRGVSRFQSFDFLGTAFVFVFQVFWLNFVGFFNNLCFYRNGCLSFDRTLISFQTVEFHLVKMFDNLVVCVIFKLGLVDRLFKAGGTLA